MGCLTSRLPTWLQKSCLLLCDWLDSPRAGCLYVCASRTWTCSATLVTALRICRHVLMSDPAQKPFAATAQWHPTVLPYFAAAFGPGGLDALSAALCRPPLSNSFRINTKRITLAVGVLRCVYHHAQPSLSSHGQHTTCRMRSELYLQTQVTLRTHRKVAGQATRKYLTLLCSMEVDPTMSSMRIPKVSALPPDHPTSHNLADTMS